MCKRQCLFDSSTVDSSLLDVASCLSKQVLKHKFLNVKHNQSLIPPINNP